jgi:long-subunit acyl-CoA synthetase (AMP-forming)
MKYILSFFDYFYKKWIKKKNNSLYGSLIWTYDRNKYKKLWGTKIKNNVYEWKNYHEIFSKSQSFQIILQNNSINQNDIVILCSPNKVEWIVADLACCFSGIVTIPMDPLFNDEVLNSILYQTNPKAILYHPSLNGRFDKFEIKKIKIDVTKTLDFDSDKVLKISENEDKNYLFTIQPTSGSTGVPKLLKRNRYNFQRLEGDKDTMVILASLSSPAPRTWMWIDILSGGCMAESSMETLIEVKKNYYYYLGL